jgi:hypothetical protein
MKFPAGVVKMPESRECNKCAQSIFNRLIIYSMRFFGSNVLFMHHDRKRKLASSRMQGRVQIFRF